MAYKEPDLKETERYADVERILFQLCLLLFNWIYFYVIYLEKNSYKEL